MQQISDVWRLHPVRISAWYCGFHEPPCTLIEMTQVLHMVRSCTAQLGRIEILLCQEEGLSSTMTPMLWSEVLRPAFIYIDLDGDDSLQVKDTAGHTAIGSEDPDDRMDAWAAASQWAMHRSQHGQPQKVKHSSADMYQPASMSALCSIACFIAGSFQFVASLACCIAPGNGCHGREEIPF